LNLRVAAESDRPTQGKRLVKKLVQSSLKKFGLQLVRGNSLPRTTASPPASDVGLDCFFAALQPLGFHPKHIIDIGANRGAWTRKALAYFPEAHYTLVEPQDHLKVHIQDLLARGCKITWVNAGAADQSGTLPFTISYRNDSSTFDPTLADAGAERISVPVMTLNEIASAAGAPPAEIVKIDAEGFDLKVLAGASDLLGKTDVFFVEVMICCPGHENTIARVVRRMDEAGYRVVDVTDINRSPKHGVLWLCELAFLRNDSSLFANVTSYE
jgi:FkbM family methyltransferase